VALLPGVDRIMNSMRVVVSLLGNCVAVLVVFRWERVLDLPLVRRVLTEERAGVPEESVLAGESGEADVNVKQGVSVSD
jgi:Na+/H+-dicarboxylate symporter